MKLYSLQCPHCGGNLEAEEDLESFFCKYCGTKIVMDRISKSQMRIREMEHDETMSEHKMRMELEKLKADQAESKQGTLIMIGSLIFSAIFLIGIFVLVLLK